MDDFDFGGHMRLRLADGTNLKLRGNFTLSTSPYSIEGRPNSDGSNSRLATPKARTAEVTLEDTDIDFAALLTAGRQDIYITEDFTGRGHVFLNAFFSGSDNTDRVTGEVTNLVIEGSGYRRTVG